VHVALGRAGVTADRAVFIGDAVWDPEAARRAGVTCIGVLSGNVSRSEKHSAGGDLGAEVKPLTDAGISQP
jgi:phosphoglycolate phosphatase-like HAD superfamily hydrolase